jgi:hypothetical protein
MEAVVNLDPISKHKREGAKRGRRGESRNERASSCPR